MRNFLRNNKELIQCVFLIALLCINVLKLASQIRENSSDSTYASIAEAKETGLKEGSPKTGINLSEAPNPVTSGDVFELSNYGIRIQVNGILSMDSQVDNGTSYTYVSATDNSDKVLSVTVITADLDSLTDAYNKYLSGKVDDLLKSYTVTQNEDDKLDYYVQHTSSGTLPVIYDETSKQTYMFIGCMSNSSTAYLVLNCSEPFAVTNNIVTATYGDPAADAQESHTYSKYEETASAATLASLDSTESADYSSTEVSSGKDPSDSGSTARDNLASLAKYSFDTNGKSTETKQTIDITSSDALASQWKLTQTTYSYTNGELTVSNVSAKRTSSQFTISGNVNNSGSDARPYVLLCKFLNDSGGLLAVQVYDCRNKPITANGVTTFTVTLNSSTSLDLSAISSIMFEVA